MELYIENPANLELNSFLHTIIIPHIKLYIVSHLQSGPIEAIEEYLNSPTVLESLLTGPSESAYIDAKAIILAAASNLVVKQIDNNYIISVNSEKIVPGCTAKLIDLISLINYGSMGSPSYPIMDNAFNDIARNFNSLYKEYSIDVS